MTVFGTLKYFWIFFSQGMEKLYNQVKCLIVRDPTLRNSLGFLPKVLKKAFSLKKNEIK